MMTIERDAIKLNGYVILIRPMCDETSNNCDIIKNRVASYKSKNKINYSNVLSGTNARNRCHNSNNGNNSNNNS